MSDRHKQVARPIAVTIGVFLLSLTLSGCSSLHRVTGDQFQRAAGRIGEVHTAHCTSYIGTNGARAYIEYWRAPLWGSGVRVLWTPLSDLPEELADLLKTGQNPWVQKTQPPTDEQPGR